MLSQQTLPRIAIARFFEIEPTSVVTASCGLGDDVATVSTNCPSGGLWGGNSCSRHHLPRRVSLDGRRVGQHTGDGAAIPINRRRSLESVRAMPLGLLQGIVPWLIPPTSRWERHAWGGNKVDHEMGSRVMDEAYL